MEHQIRIVEVIPGKMDEFVTSWTAHAARLRRRRGFTIEGAWALAATNQFIWFLGYDGEDGFAAAERAYLESEEYKAMDDDPYRFAVENNVYTVGKVV